MPDLDSLSLFLAVLPYLGICLSVTVLCWGLLCFLSPRGEK